MGPGNGDHRTVVDGLIGMNGRRQQGQGCQGRSGQQQVLMQADRSFASIVASEQHANLPQPDRFMRGDAKHPSALSISYKELLLKGRGPEANGECFARVYYNRNMFA
jgi:hypothetical protein